MLFNYPQKKIVTFLVIIASSVVLCMQPALAQETEQLAKKEVSVTINGHILDASNGTGISGVIVKIPELNIKTVTNQEGKFSFTNLSPNGKDLRNVTLNANLYGFEELSEKVNILQFQDLKLEIKPKPPIE